MSPPPHRLLSLSCLLTWSARFTKPTVRRRCSTSPPCTRKEYNKASMRTRISDKSSLTQNSSPSSTFKVESRSLKSKSWITPLTTCSDGRMLLFDPRQRVGEELLKMLTRYGEIGYILLYINRLLLFQIHMTGLHGFYKAQLGSCWRPGMYSANSLLDVCEERSLPNQVVLPPDV